MRRDIAIDSSLDDEPGVTQRNSDTPATLTDDDKRVAQLIFSNSVDSMDVPAKVAASELGMAAPHLSEYRNGVRPVAFYRLIRGARKSTEFKIALIRAIAGISDDVQITITRKRKTDKKAVREQMALTLERNPSLRRIAITDAAAALGIDEQEATEILDEPTAEHFIAGVKR